MLASTYLALFFLFVAPVLAGPLEARHKKHHQHHHHHHHHHHKSHSPTSTAAADSSTRDARCTETDGVWSCTWADAPMSTFTVADPSPATPTPTSTPTPTDTDTDEPCDDDDDTPPTTSGGDTDEPCEDGGEDGGPTETPTPPACEGSNCYSVSKNWVGDAFLADGDDDWEFFAKADPTHGRVQYVDRDTAVSANLTYASDSSFVMRTDYKNTYESSGKGRESVRINTKTKYTTVVMVADVRHMPEGDGTWPALWSVGDNWPNNGELDIVEGINDQAVNHVSLHTSKNCTQPASSENRKMSGAVGYFDCDAKGAKGNKGCGVDSPSDKSFGPGFNKNGGGWWAIERTPDTIKVWFWERGAQNVPADVRDNTGSTGPDSWGLPDASFVSDSCDISKKFGLHKFVINLTLCGDWAGKSYDGGKSACEDHVNNHPDAFKNAYWDIARMSLYEK